MHLSMLDGLRRWSRRRVFSSDAVTLLTVAAREHAPECVHEGESGRSERGRKADL